MLSADPSLLPLAPLLDLRAFTTDLPRPLGALPGSPELAAYMSLETASPLPRPDDRVRKAVRDLLRAPGLCIFKPTGRNKPASEYLLLKATAAAGGALPAINPAVDACNAASLHGGLPISVIDLDLATAPLTIAVPPAGASYIFNPSGQVIAIGGLISLCDAAGPCAGPVKDSQRTKTGPDTRRTLSIVWGTTALPGLAAATTAFYRQLLDTLDATTTPVPLA